MNQDYRTLAFVGQPTTSQPYLFSAANVKCLSARITSLLKATGKTIVVSDRVIAGVISNIAANFIPRVGDIYIKHGDRRADLQNINEQVVTVIVNTVQGEIEQQICNSRLTVWDSVLGTYNSKGLVSHSSIKLKENDHMKGMFSMNY